MARQPLERLLEHLRNVGGRAQLIGTAPSFLQALAPIERLAESDATVLINGETGTGKELVARALHYLGPRRGCPFVPVNCGALPDTLLESELFGHERGAFTDAQLRKSGLVAQAEHGTMFLDEVEALSDRGQVALLRVLQDKSFRLVGSIREQRTDVRFIAATNVQLEALVHAGRFRPDLYYRLCVLTILLPRLRDRLDDILTLAEHFLDKHRPKSSPFQLTAGARGALLAYDWPGNVRELENAIIRGIHMSTGQVIGVEELGLPSSSRSATEAASEHGQRFTALKRKMVTSFEHDYLTRLLAEHCGNVTHAARIAGQDRRALGKLLKKHHIDPNVYRGPAAERGLAW